MFKGIVNRIRLARLRRAIKVVEKAGLSAVQIKQGKGAVYLIAGNGQYVRFDKVKP